MEKGNFISFRKGGMKMLMGAEILSVPGGFQKSVRPKGRG